jgi:hypothetical protein
MYFSVSLVGLVVCVIAEMLSDPGGTYQSTEEPR